MSPVPTTLESTDLLATGGEVTDDVPVYLGYNDVAVLAKVSPGAIRFYHYKDLRNGKPHLMAKPDIILTRGKAGYLPGWTLPTIKAWLANRIGPGNSTSGDDRRGFKGKDAGTSSVAELLP